MTDDGYYPDLEHLSSRQPAGKNTFQTAPRQHPSGMVEAVAAHAEKEFKDYFCPFCGYKLFRGKVRDFKMACHGCNRLVDSKTIRE